MKTQSTLLMMLTIGLMSCNETQTTETVVEEVVMEQPEAEEAPTMNIDSVVMVIDAKRNTIEASLTEPVELSAESFRAKTKQKWQRLHFYTDNGQVVRIKSYPYEDVSPRTEEFYFDNGALILAVIEDDGSGEKGKPKEAIDKMYYFHDGALISEHRLDDKEEFGVRESDGEELQAEAREYLSLFEASAKK